jgi:hypothetical protein
MVLGFNHNLMYKGHVFHVQTEDSGIDNPHIITLLYRGGVIISSRKTSYADILRMESLEIVVEELMKEQHKEMMRRLKAGDFDDKAFSVKAPLLENYEIPLLEPQADPIADVFSSPTGLRGMAASDVSLLFDIPHPSSGISQNVPTPPRQQAASEPDVTIDDAIRNFFDTYEKKHENKG